MDHSRPEGFRYLYRNFFSVSFSLSEHLSPGLRKRIGMAFLEYDVNAWIDFRECRVGPEMSLGR